MAEFSGYRELKKIAEGSSTVVYSAVREGDELPVILKTLRSEHPSVDMIALMYHEYDVVKDLDLAGVIKTYDLIDTQNHYALVQEDVHGISLHAYLLDNPLKTLDLFFTWALQMAQVVSELHRRHIIHKDIKPANFIIDPNTFAEKLTDFNYSSKLVHEVQEIVPPNRLEGTLAYMAPEQTGRMNMNMDYRSDLYALGVTFYEILTGSLPFNSRDPLELLHAHLASPPPALVNPKMDIPPVLTQIVHKLMAKNPSERYQSAIGLHSDLERCQKSWQEKGVIEDFDLGQEDVFDSLNLSQKLYGREEETRVLLETYQRVSRGAVQVLMVRGYSGIGKTMLINEVHRPMVEHKGFFISGKFDQLQRNKPFSAMTQALNQLARSIIAEPEARYQRIKTALIDALDSQGQILVDLAPDMELIIGPQPPLDSLPAQETQNRMMIYFKKFLTSVANQEHPLVMFIDDLQWADSGTLVLLERMLTDEELSHILLIGAYRDNEVDETHPLVRLLDVIESRRHNLTYLTLRPLSPEHFSALFAASFLREPAVIEPFAHLVHQKTQGNPFFCKQVISTLYKEHLLYFDYSTRQWSWDINAITSFKITDNVVDLMCDKLLELPAPTQQILKYASCVGNQFTVKLLELISGQSSYQIGQLLWPALEQELLLSLKLGHKRMDALGQPEISAFLSQNITYQFIHDRVQQAVYQGLSSDERQHTHLRIAQLLLEKEPEACRKELLFEVTDHFNEALDLLNPEDCIAVVELNYQAAVQAKNATAYQPMCNYLKAALSLMTDAWWSRAYDLTFKVNREYALSLFLINQSEKSEKELKRLLTCTQTNFDQASLYRILMMIYYINADFKKATEVFYQALQLLGVKIKAQPSLIGLVFQLKRLQRRLNRVSDDYFITQAKPVTDVSIEAAFEILAEAFLLFFQKDPKLFAGVMITAMDLQLTYGVARNLGFFIGLYGLVVLTAFKNIEVAYKYWTLAQRLFEMRPDKYSSGTYNVASFFIISLREPLRVTQAAIERGIQDSQESGNLNLLRVAYLPLVYMALIEGKSLQKVINSAQKGYSLSAQTTNSLSKPVLELYFVIAQTLADGMEHSDRLRLLEDKVVQCDSVLFQLGAIRTLSYYAYFMERPEQSLKYHRLWYPYDHHVWFLPNTIEAKCIFALCLAPEIGQSHGIKKIRNQRLFKKLVSQLKWISDECPANYLHLYLVVLGVQAQLKKCDRDALAFFNRAIEQAKKEDCYVWVAHANELAAMHCIAIAGGDTRTAMEYIREAHYFYERFGMMVKVWSLERRYPECFKTERELSSQSHSSVESSLSETAPTNPVSFDFISIVKASQTISGEIIVERLVEKMLHIINESAGSEKALFIEQVQNKWMVSASLIQNGEGEFFNRVSLPLDNYTHLPQTVIQSVLRSKETLVLDNASEDPLYRNDPYLLDNPVKSILCLSIVYQQNMIGLIYLENNLSSGVFTQGRVMVLNTLASQIAISLENARHFEVMEQLYRKTERFVPKSFLKLLNKEHLEDVVLGDSVEARITVLFTDIRDYTTITEKQTPKEAFAFINNYLKTMAPIIRKYGGFINQFQGDAIMALFPGQADDGVKAVIEMSQALICYNETQKASGQAELEVGYGLNTGLGMLGTIGEEERMDANIISDAVNLSSRVESLNKYYGTKFLISDSTYNSLTDKAHYVFRLVDKVQVKGKKQVLHLYEVVFGEQIDEREHQFIREYEAAFECYVRGDMAEAKVLFERCLELKPDDRSAELLIERCTRFLHEGLPTNWDAVYTQDQK